MKLSENFGSNSRKGQKSNVYFLNFQMYLYIPRETYEINHLQKKSIFTSKIIYIKGIEQSRDKKCTLAVSLR